MKTRHNRKESRIAVYQVLLSIYQSKVAGKKYSLAGLCATNHCGSIKSDIIEAMDWGRMPVYEDAAVVMAARRSYNYAHAHGNRKTAKEAVEEAREKGVETTLGELEQAQKVVAEMMGAEPDKDTLYPELSLVPQAIKICQAAGLIVSRPL